MTTTIPNLAGHPSVYTSPVGHPIPQARCHPHCQLGQGDWYHFQEPLPYELNPSSGRLFWSDPNATPFENWSVSIDNENRIATVSVQSRTGPVTVYLQGDIIGQEWMLRTGTPSER